MSGEPHYDFHHPEDVLIEVITRAKAPGGWEVTETYVMGKAGEPLGAASYQQNEAGLFHYVIKDILEPLSPGYYVVMGVTATWHEGDGWTCDDDIRFTYERVRHATAKEVEQYM